MAWKHALPGNLYKRAEKKAENARLRAEARRERLYREEMDRDFHRKQLEDKQDYFTAWATTYNKRAEEPIMELRDPWGEFILRWAARFGEREVTVLKLLEALPDPIMNVLPGEIDEFYRRLGGKLKYNQNRVFGTYKLIRTGSTGGYTRWKLVNTAPSGNGEMREVP